MKVLLADYDQLCIKKNFISDIGEGYDPSGLYNQVNTLITEQNNWHDDLTVSMFGKILKLPRTKAFYCSYERDNEGNVYVPWYQYTGSENEPDESVS